MVTVNFATKNEVIGLLRIAGFNMKQFAVEQGYEPDTVRKVVGRYAGSKKTPEELWRKTFCKSWQRRSHKSIKLRKFGRCTSGPETVSRNQLRSSVQRITGSIANSSLITMIQFSGQVKQVGQIKQGVQYIFISRAKVGRPKHKECNPFAKSAVTAHEREGRTSVETKG